MTKQVFQIHISLRDINPKIWRRILVNSEIYLIDLHRIIQTTMGWTNSHLHQFEVGKLIYAPDEFELVDSIDYDKIKLNKVLHKDNKKIKYEYDFGDSWMHDILLEKILPYDNTLKLPTLIDGKRNCPPEDCGGTRGYDELLKIISNTKHKEHFEMLEWLGGEFDPENIDIEEINELLKEDDYGCIWL